MTVTYQDPCHLAHGQRVRGQPRKLLQAIPGLKLNEMEAPTAAAAAPVSTTLPIPACRSHLLQEKMQSMAATQAGAVVAPNPGCMLQLRYGARQLWTRSSKCIT